MPKKDPLQPTHSSKKLIITATTIGNILEWYEFELFLYLSPKISTLFFPKHDSDLVALINILLIFSIGCLSRPLGGIFFGYIGDRYGRRLALLSSIILITIPTFLIAFIPTYAQIGYASPILLCCLRFLQGFPLGGEFPGTMCYLMENAKPNERGFMSSFALFGALIGVTFNIIECLIMSYFLTDAQILSWGWRLSFFFGGLIGLTGLFLRFQLKETPLFETLEKKHEIIKAPLHKVLKNYKKSILYIFFIAALPLSSSYFIFIYTGIYLEQVFHLTRTEGLMINGLFLIQAITILPFIGLVSQRFGVKKILLSSAALTAILSIFLHLMAKNPHLPLILFFEFIIVILVSFHFAMICQSLSGLFPTEIRFTGLALGYNVCSGFIAGSVPFLSIVLAQKTHGIISPSIVLMSLALFTFAGIFPLKEKEGLLVID